MYARRRLGTKINGIIRKLHTIPELDHVNKDIGIPGLLSAKGLDIAWFQYQTHLINQLNQLTQNTVIENLSPYELLRELPANSEIDLSESGPRMLYQIAAQAYNNEFFFRSVKESVNAQTAKVAIPTSEELRHVDISKNVYNTNPDLTGVSRSESSATFGSTGYTVESPAVTFENLMKTSFDTFLSFRELLISTADAMFGSGYVWLVQDTKSNSLHVLNTYSAGTPFDKKYLPPHEVESPLVPLLCLSTWEHSFLSDYGFTGKRRYLENAFDSINWKMVLERMPVARRMHNSIRP